MFGDRHQRCKHGWGHPPFGRWFGRGIGPGGFGASYWERGDLKYVILDLLKDKPRHGYEIIQELEKQFHGFYSPSPGSVYPILQLLEDQDYLTSNQQGGKKVYTITDEGKRLLAEHDVEIKEMQSRWGKVWGEENSALVHELINEVRQIGQLVFREAARGELNDPDKLKRLREAVGRARSEIESVFTDASKTTDEK